MMSLARALRRHPKHSVIPIIFLTETSEDACVLAERGAQDFMFNHIISDDLRGRLQLSARRGRLLRAMNGFLRTCSGESVRDPASGAFTALFFSEHGARLCLRAEQTGRPLSFAAISLSASFNDGKKGSPSKKSLHQVARLINRITRAEDVVARIANDTFMIAMPATIVKDAKTVGLRVEGVLGNTVFRQDKGDDLFSVQSNLTVFERPHGATIEDVAVSAIKKLRTSEKTKRAVPQTQSPQ